jgi:L-2-hydroxyglutarate oxidase LhgO
MIDIDAVIIGAGINGMFSALEFSKQFPHLDVALFEKEAFVGEHSTSRNSGVLHSGIYYPLNSLKKKLCLEGNKIWHKLGIEKKIKINRCGKYIISCTHEEKKILTQLYDRAQNNGVEGISWVNAQELDELNSIVHVKDAFFSRNTGSIDLADTIKILEKDIYNKNIPLMKGNEVFEIQLEDNNFIVRTNKETLKTRIIINTAGLYAVKLRRMVGLFDLEDYWVKGNYLKYSKKLNYSSLIYPVPLKKLKGLGVHTSFDSDGSIRFGPNAEEVSELFYGLNDEKIKENMYLSISKIFKGIQKEFLNFDYSGIRSKIKLKGKLHEDFWIKGPKELGIPGYYEMCGIESPGLTASPAIAKYIIKKISEEEHKKTVNL